MPSGVKRTHDQFIAELAQVNPHIVPLSVYQNVKTAMRFKCDVCQSEWTAMPARILRSGYCPCCSKRDQAKSKTKSHESFAAEVALKSPNTMLLGTYVNSNTRINCRCHLCGNEWQALPSTLLRGGGCPKCARKTRSNKRLKTNDQFLSELQAITPTIMPHEQYKGGKTPIEVECLECGHTWFAKPEKLLVGRGCPYCHRHNQTSFMEQFILHALRLAMGEREVMARDRTAIGLELDIYIPSAKFAIEPGSWHWHSRKAARKRDARKREIAHKKGIRVLFIYTDYHSDFPPFDDDCIVYKEDLGKEKDPSILISLIERILGMLGAQHAFTPGEIESTSQAATDATRHIRPDEYKKRIETINPQVEVLGDYSNAVTPIECRCKECGHVWFPLPYNLHMGKGCPVCSYSDRGQKRRLTNSEFLEKVALSNPSVQVLSSYKRSSEKVACKCSICGHEWNVRAGNLMRGIGCPNCARLKNAKRSSRPVVCIDTCKEFESVTAAAAAVGKSATAITASIRKGTKCGGYRWQYTDMPASSSE